MFACLPTPKIYSLGLHAYCLPTDCLQHHLSHGYKTAFFSIPPNPPTIYSHLKYSPRGIQIGTRNIDSHSVAAFLWSDDCDPQNSKKNRKALWCLTITFIQDEDVLIDTDTPTYCIAIGPKGTNHQLVIKKILDNLASFVSTNTPLYSYTGVGEIPIPLSLTIFAYLGDQPERRQLNSLMAGNSTHHARWRYSCNISKITSVMRACTKCEDRFLDSAISNTLPSFDQCSTCTNWWLHEDHPLLTYPAPSAFPTNYTLGGEPRLENDGISPLMLRPIKLTYQILQKVCTLTHDMIVTRQWGSTAAESFLSTHCINTALTKDILTRADNCLQFQMAMANTEDPETRNLFISEKRSRPRAFTRATLPPFFSCSLDLDCFVDPPLHIIGLGFLKTTMRLIDTYTTSRGRKSEFLSLIRPELQHIQNLDLDWCEVLTKQFGGKYGGYISDNYMAIAHICPWLYTPLLILREPEPYTEPTTPVDKWRIIDCKGFLDLRGLDVPKYVADM